MSSYQAPDERRGSRAWAGQLGVNAKVLVAPLFVAVIALGVAGLSLSRIVPSRLI
jgi:hypothetical protein